MGKRLNTEDTQKKKDLTQRAQRKRRTQRRGRRKI
jgi:hypothetical protein